MQFPFLNSASKAQIHLMIKLTATPFPTTVPFYWHTYTQIYWMDFQHFDFLAYTVRRKKNIKAQWYYCTSPYLGWTSRVSFWVLFQVCHSLVQFQPVSRTRQSLYMFTPVAVVHNLIVEVTDRWMARTHTHYYSSLFELSFTKGDMQRHYLYTVHFYLH